MEEIILLNNEELLYRKKISNIEKPKVENITFYFVSNGEVYCPVWGDYIEFQSVKKNWEKFDKILLKDNIELNDIAELVILCDLSSDYFLNHRDELVDGLKKDLKNVDINSLYFSYEYFN